MRYLVGRACAVAGYADLYEELDLLPEVSIAEEARDNSLNEASKAIFESIMGKPVCYRVLDDYTRSCHADKPICPAFMNGDTAVRSSLDVRHGLDKHRMWRKHYFNIAEDHNVDEVSSEKRNVEAVAPEHVELFYTPLLSHLPTTNKDALILMAAYEGNIERYARLRRPLMLHDEVAAIVRGIYHNTTFARWWWHEKAHQQDRTIKTAVVARFIMVNDLSHITPSIPDPDHMPAMIWWPLIPQEETLRELHRRRPDMHLQVAMACIAGDFRVLWDELSPEPCLELWNQAEQKQRRHFPNSPSRNFYTEYIERRAKEMSMDVNRLPGLDDICEDAAVPDKEPGTTWLDDGIYALDYAFTDSNPDTCLYNGLTSQPNAASWELFICSSEGMRRYARLEQGVRLYDEEFVAAFPFYHENDRHSRKARDNDAWELPEKYLPAK
ncbi:hypothetical protein CMUS01_14742 [Colletotrichum musicola]|uniref:Uncharacterized protein n=1 Tax=Colletotrichum musicola TaxID=2175873 RepID=A0A8H6J2E0_9PEZI|nr:hypothetical protein CMUS01_14742 [Colletotrichum musicola]